MSQEGDGRLRFQLDRLEAEGARVLRATARREALVTALAWAAPASLVGSVLSLAWSLSSGAGPGAGALVAVAAIIPPATAACVYLWRAPRGGADRRQALALFDHCFGLKDRIVTADQFAADAGRGAFEAAALIEAAPWIERAQGLSLDRPKRLSLRWSRLWLYPIGGAALLALALAIPQDGRPAAARLEAPFQAVQAAVSSVRQAAVTASPPAQVAPVAAGKGAGLTPKADGRREGAAREASPTMFQRALSALGLKAGEGGGEAEPSAPTAGAGRSAAGAGEGRKAAGRGAQGENQDSGATPGSQDGAAPALPVQASDGRTASDERAGSGDAAKAQPQGGSARQDAPSQRPPPSQNGSQSSQSGEGQQPQSGRSRKGDSNSNGREQGGGEGENGRRSGDEAGAKKGRGVASLLLATPMQDRLTGMASEGRVATTTRDGRPQAFPSQAAQAQDRGVAATGVAGAPARTDAAHDQRLLRDVFSRRPAKDGN